MLFSTFDCSFFWVSAPSHLKLCPQKNEELVGGNKFSTASPPFYFCFDVKYTPLAFSKDIPGPDIMNSGLLSLGVFISTRLLPSRNTGQKTDAERCSRSDHSALQQPGKQGEL